MAGGSRWRDGRWRGRAPGVALPSACGFPAVSIICRNGHCEMLSSGAHCRMTVVRRTASPEHADFGGLSSLAALVVVRLEVVPLPPSSPRRWCRVVCWADILLDVIGGVERGLLEGCPRTMTGVSQYWFSGHFRQVFSTPMHYPALTLATTCGANRAS